MQEGLTPSPAHIKNSQFISIASLFATPTPNKIISINKNIVL